MKEQLLNQVENILTKREIDHYEPQFFQKAFAAEASEKVCLWERDNHLYK